MQTYPLVLLANEPCSYRSLLAAELPLLRPNLRVLEIDPDDLDAVVARLRPAVVVCSRVLEQALGLESAILLLYPAGEDALIRNVDGADQKMASPRLADVLSAIDHAVPRS
ncbi:MAG: hypothetical protein KC442_04955 [Thermomicrobiales bacterium]|nr:hypothetical protein [Thermomicrobiales bacterium]